MNPVRSQRQQCAQRVMSNMPRDIRNKSISRDNDQSLATSNGMNHSKKSTRPNTRVWIVFLVFPLILSTFYFILPAPRAQASLTSGLVGYWTFDGKDTNWGTNKTNDLSGQGNTGTLTNMSTTTSPVVGKIGQGLKFDGSNDYVNAGSGSSVNVTGAITACFWVKTSSTSMSGVMGNRGGSGIGGYSIILRGEEGGGANYRISFTYFGVLDWYSSNNAYIANNQWQHLCVVNPATGDIRFYANGAQHSTAASANSGISSDQPLYVGAWNNSGSPTNYFNGLIDDVRIYNRALSAGEVRQLYKLGAAKLAVSPVNSLKSGLVGYWTFDGKDTNWGTNKTNDLSGQGNTGTMTSMSTTTSPVVGKIGQGLKFDGVNDYVNVGDVAAIDNSNTQLSISAWFKMDVLPTSAATRQAIIIKYDATANEREFLVLVGHNITNDWNKITWNVQEVATAYDSTTDLKGSTILTTNRWYHVVVTYQGGNHMRIYLDGNLEVEDTTGIPTDFTNTAEPLYVGWLEDADRSFNGLIDDVRIYNRALSAGEITQLYKQGAAKLAVSPVNSLKSGLVGYWTFDGKDTNWGTNKTNDLSGQGNTGTLTSMSTTTSPVVGKLGQGLKFDGVDDYVETTSFPALASTYSYVAWIKLNALPGASEWEIISKSSATRHIGILNNKLVAWNGSSPFASGGTTLSTGQWYHAVNTYDGTTNKLYLNGVFDGSAVSTATADSGVLSIGYLSGFVRYFNGLIDEVRVYNRALSANEVKQLYNIGR